MEEEYTLCGNSIDYCRQNRAEIPTRHERYVEGRYQTRTRGTGYSPLTPLRKSFSSPVQLSVNLAIALSILLSCNCIAFTGLTRSTMFVQAPALLVQQKSENSEEGSDEEGTGDVLQVYCSFAFWPSIFYSHVYFLSLLSEALNEVTDYRSIR